MCLTALPLTAVAQRAWHLGLTAAAARSGFTDRVELTFRPLDGSAGVNPGYGSGPAATATYHLGLQISGELTDRLTLEIEPRYWRLRHEYQLTLGQPPNQTYINGRVVGGTVQLPLGLRWRFGRPGSLQPHLLGRVVSGLTQTAVEPPRLVPNSRTPSLLSIGLDGVGLHWQLGLEGGIGVVVRQRVGLNLLYYHGLRPTRLARPDALLLYEANDGGQYLYTAQGVLAGRLNALSLQAVAYFN
ncbi:hypothetical protein GCM10028821_05150 [Hymenobacter jeollabukensis]